MSAGGYILGLLRLAATLTPAWVCARAVRSRLPPLDTALAALAGVIIALSSLLLAAETLGLIGLLRTPELIALLWLAAAASLWRSRDGRARGPGAEPLESGPGSGGAAFPTPVREVRAGRGVAALALGAVATQWALQTANSLGSGMPSFDTLWYHMPFAARFAQTGSITAIQFTQADPFVAYFPANSELLHAVGILAMHGDVLSPLLNLGWLVLALLAAYSLGRPWGVGPATLTAVAAVIALPVLSSTQPGEAFNDVAGLACLLAGAALALEMPGEPRMAAVAGLALGLAAGTKLTFIVPVGALLIGASLLASPGRLRSLAMATIAAVATGGWWYLRNLLAVGNPFGLSIDLGPVRLPGPSSPLAAATQQTVASELGHISLWASRFLPGLNHAFGPLWPLLLTLCTISVAIAALSADRRARLLAAVALLAGLSYFFLPTGASGIERGTTLFQVNLRYLTPALALAAVLLPIAARMSAPRALPALGPVLLVVLLAAQFEPSLWPAQPVRHVAFAAACVAAGLFGGLGMRTWRGRPGRARTDPWRLAVAGIAGLSLVAIGFAAQRHYFDRRYLLGSPGNPGLGAIDRWAQGVAHTRIALYGSVEQYPLYGAHDTNAVDYLGASSGGNYRPIASCMAWRAALERGHYRYVVLTPPPTAPIPLAWTTGYPGATPALQPSPGYYVFRLGTEPPVAASLRC